jgi:DNA-binding CsgD family transcriptional regulator
MRNPESVVEQIVALWKDHFQGDLNPQINQKIADQMGVFDHLRQSNLQTVVFSFEDLSILYINEAAADFFESDIEQIKKEGAPYIISCFDPAQLKFATWAAEKSAKDMAESSPSDIINSYTCFSNWIINTRNGKRKRGFFRIFPIQVNNRGLPRIGMYLIHDIMPFLHDQNWWYRISLGVNRFQYYHSEEKKLMNKDLLSEREKEILREIAAGLSSKELGEKLNLSSHTVDNHRRRMLAKTGAVDTSALIHVAKLTGFI